MQTTKRPLFKKRTIQQAAIASMVTLALSSASFAYETDQLTYRDRGLKDVGDVMDERLNEWLETARVNTENSIKGKWSDEKIAGVLRANILAQHSVDKMIFGTPLEKWMREELVDEYGVYPVFMDGDQKFVSIYSQYRTMVEGLPSIFRMFAFDAASKWVGKIVAATFEVNGHRFGADKLSHFFRLGYREYVRSDHGARPDIAAAYGTQTEASYIGKQADGVFSFADLAANFNGFEFYRDLVATASGHVVKDPMFKIVRGNSSYPWVRIVQLRPFHMSDYVSDDWDEYYNPNSYTEPLLGAVKTHLNKFRPRYCTEYSRWKSTRDFDHRNLRPKSEYVDVSRAPEQFDPFEIEKLCDLRDGPVSAIESLKTLKRLF